MTAPLDADRWHALLTPEHFWMQWRLRAFLRLARELGEPLEKPLRVLDARCRNGALRAQIEARTGWSVDEAPSAARVYDIVLLFDVLEHEADEAGCLAEAVSRLKPGGRLYVNVPALPALYGRHDRLAGHLRRYDRSALTAALARAGLEVEACRHWGLALVPLAAARGLLTARCADEEAARRGFMPPGRWADALLRAVMRLETALPCSAPVGTSILAAVRKP